MALIKIQNFKKAFDGKEIHNDVSFSVQEGECFGLLGGSGVGKSVLLRSIIGLEKPDSGHVIVEEDDITFWTEEQLVEIRKKVAYVFQNGALFDSMTVYQNLKYPLVKHTDFSESKIRETVKDLLDDFGLSDTEDKYPDQLSGGMQKRVGLARSIILSPKVILYDEPTAGLDPHNTRLIQDLILRLKKRNVTSILVTHDMPTAEIVCDRIGLLGMGEVCALGTPEELALDPQNMLKNFIDGIIEVKGAENETK